MLTIDQIKGWFNRYIITPISGDPYFNKDLAIADLYGGDAPNDYDAASFAGLINNGTSGEDILDFMVKSLITQTVLGLSNTAPDYTVAAFSDRYKSIVRGTGNIDLSNDYNDQAAIIFVADAQAKSVDSVGIPELWKKSGGAGIVISTKRVEGLYQYQIAMMLSGRTDMFWRVCNPGSTTWGGWQSVPSGQMSTAEIKQEEIYLAKTLKATGDPSRFASGTQFYRFATPVAKTASTVDWSKAYTAIEETTLSGGVPVINYRRAMPFELGSGDTPVEITLEDVDDPTTITPADPAWVIDGAQYTDSRTVKSVLSAVASQTDDNQITLEQVYDAAYYKFSMALGEGAVVAGKNTLASGDQSFATGNGTVAAGDNQVVIGRYNIPDDDASFIIGNGEDDEHRSNLVTSNELEYLADMTEILSINDIYDYSSLHDPLMREMLKKYMAFLQGAVAATNGEYYESDQRCVTDYIPIVDFHHFYKPTGMQARVHKYNDSRTYIATDTFNANVEKTYTKADVGMTTGYVRVDVSNIVSGETSVTTPDDVRSSNFSLYYASQWQKHHAVMELEGGVLMTDGRTGSLRGGHQMYRRSQKMARISGDVTFVFDEDDYQNITAYSIWQYRTVSGQIVFDSWVRVASPLEGDNTYNYHKPENIEYLKLVVVPSEAARARTFKPVDIYSEEEIHICYNPDIRAVISGVRADCVDFTYDVANGVWTRGCLILPPNYSVDGEPVPLHVYCHGTGGMDTWGCGIGNMWNPEHTVDHPVLALMNYQADEGFAVFDCYPWTSKYCDADETSDSFISPFIIGINERAYIEGIKYVCSRYNINIDWVCVSGLSLGGNLAYWFAHQKEVPIKAVAMMAPTSAWAAPRFDAYFLRPSGREMVLRALNLRDETGADRFVSNGRMSDEQSTAFVQEHFREFAGMSPSNIGVAGATYRQIYDWTVTLTSAGYKPEWMDDLPAMGDRRQPVIIDHPDLSAYTPTPIKYWQAFDDTQVSAFVNYTLYSWLLNGGTPVYWRTLADEHGGHRATGYGYKDSTHNEEYNEGAEMAARTTRLGVGYEAFPAAQVEMIHFFCDCIGLEF